MGADMNMFEPHRLVVPTGTLDDGLLCVLHHQAFISKESCYDETGEDM